MKGIAVLACGLENRFIRETRRCHYGRALSGSTGAMLPGQEGNVKKFILLGEVMELSSYFFDSCFFDLVQICYFSIYIACQKYYHPWQAG
ncbi:hypothetical protein [Breznakiella homolactica]|uniref:Uncharacterized protein n=1 Tax=Breznakiella homolactica TaxID=2798577 RepID=A0A7T7XNY8_9SPIR|nr:hypothetical protein [Breznakiella homolactica]QQO09733.1 hypothetical protein JFL75_02100 [Breznakiella homolactica]